MDISRLSSSSVTGSVVRSQRDLDLTISDRGVGQTPRERTPVRQPAPEQAPAAARVASTEALQQVLTDDESRALEAAFADRGSEPSPMVARTVYGLTGRSAAAPRAAAVGRLVDFSG